MDRAVPRPTAERGVPAVAGRRPGPWSRGPNRPWALLAYELRGIEVVAFKRVTSTVRPPIDVFASSSSPSADYAAVRGPGPGLQWPLPRTLPQYPGDHPHRTVAAGNSPAIHPATGCRPEPVPHNRCCRLRVAACGRLHRGCDGFGNIRFTDPAGDRQQRTARDPGSHQRASSKPAKPIGPGRADGVTTAVLISASICFCTWPPRRGAIPVRAVVATAKPVLA